MQKMSLLKKILISQLLKAEPIATGPIQEGLLLVILDGDPVQMIMKLQL